MGDKRNRKPDLDERPSSVNPSAAGLHSQRPADGAPKEDSAGPWAMRLLPSVTMPKGGGALSGIGEKFSANPATGTASLTIPIATPPGRGGAELGLNLSYDSGAGNGPFGVGFRLSASAVSRKTDKGIPRYIDDGPETDAFVLAGAEDLVPVVGEPPRDTQDAGQSFAAWRYRPRSESAFSRIERWVDKTTHDAHWRVTTRDNVTSVYGLDAQSRIRDPKQPRHVFSWLLTKTEDDHGNVTRYEYKAEDGAGVDANSMVEASRFADGKFVGSAQRYLKRIHYGSSPATPTGFMFEVVFDYGEHVESAPDDSHPWPTRKDPFSSYRSGFEIRTYRRCERVLAYHRFPELGPAPYLVRSMAFEYHGEPKEAPYLAKLKNVTQRAHKGDATEQNTAALPGLDLEYTDLELHDTVKWLDRESLIGAEAGLTPGVDTWVDLDGEGLPGLLRTGNGLWDYKRNLGGGRFSPPERIRSLPASSNLASPGVQLVDLGGNGALDLVTLERGHEGSYERTRDRTFGPHRPFRTLPTLDWSDPNLRLVDLDGDGEPDVLITEDNVLRWYPSLGRDGYGSARQVAKPRNEKDGPAVVFADGTESIHLADMSGDGLTDIVRVRHGSVCYWPNLGHGRFGAKVQMPNAPAPGQATAFDSRRVRLADLDGSGPADYFYIAEDGSVLIAHNQAGNAWSEATTISTLPKAHALGTIEALDLLGNGTTCLVWIDRGGGALRRIGYVDLLGSVKPHVLCSIKNNMGARTELHYESSTAFYRRDCASRRPWLTRLPFPVQCLKKVVSSDLIGNHRLVTEYRYHHGHFDGHEREFAGFACVEQLDAETFDGPEHPAAPLVSRYADQSWLSDGIIHLPPVRTVTWFHTGAFFEGPHLEQSLRREYFRPTHADAWSLPDTVLPAGLSGRERREAARALRGRTLRQEVYADDGSELASVPYAITEASFEIRRVQPAQDKQPAVFFVHDAETIQHHLERRADDARIEHSFVLDVDVYGNVKLSAKVAYPRASSTIAAQAQGLCIWQQSEFSNDSRDDVHRLGVPLWQRTYQPKGLVCPKGRPLRAEELTVLLNEPQILPAPKDPFTRMNELRAAGKLEAFDLIQAERHAYWTDDLAATSWTSAGRRALRADTHVLALTPRVVSSVYGTDVDDILVGGGYATDAEGHWAPSGRVHYEPTRFYLPCRAEDPFGNEYNIAYDHHSLMVVSTSDPFVNVTLVLLDPQSAPSNFADVESPYRALQPTAILDPNANGVAITYDLFGRVVALAYVGKAGRSEGDRLSDPSVTFTYELDASPPRVIARARELHGPTNTRWQQRYSYSDGFGREIMTKVQAEPGLVRVKGPDGKFVDEWTSPRWVGTGRTVFDNKGNPIKKYEPYFSDTFEFEDEPELVETGVTPILRYDPLGRLIATLRPDGALSRTTFDAWTQTVWDENDTVKESQWLSERKSPSTSPDEKKAASAALLHADTPQSVHLDSLGRAIETRADNGVAGVYATKTAVDVKGQPLMITDPRGLVVMVQTWDLRGKSLRTLSPDAGTRTSFWDATGQLLRGWDARGVRIDTKYDSLRRPTELMVTVPPSLSGSVSSSTKAECRLRTVYGEELAPADAVAKNLRTRPYRVYDGAGELTTTHYTFRGQPEASERRLLRAKKGAPIWPDPVAAPDEVTALLESEPHLTATKYDALNRVIQEDAPDGSVTKTSYNEAGFLETLETTPRGGAPLQVIAGAEYNARGQRVALDFGAPASARRPMRTAHDYDPLTFRLRRILTWRPTAADRTKAKSNPAFVYPRPKAAEAYYQYSTYTLDPVGNVIVLRNGARLEIIQGHDIASGDAEYHYDAIYRLLEATGREHPGQVPGHEETLAGSLPHTNDTQRLQRYSETYTYDQGGNIRTMRHAGAVTWKMPYTYEGDGLHPPLSNRLISTAVPGGGRGSATGTYTYDANGNMTAMPGLADLSWSWDDKLASVTTAAGTIAHYQYDASGQRVRKLVEYLDPSASARGDVIEKIYLGTVEVRWRTSNGVTSKLEQLHLANEGGTVALLERREGGPTELYFQLSDHLHSGTVEVRPDGQVSTYEEYSPWGRASVQLTDGRERRLRFNGKERDDESGLHYFGARYYAAWLGRWTACDPAGFVDGPNVFAYAKNSPATRGDPTGLATAPPSDTASRVEREFRKERYAILSTRYPQEYYNIYDVVDANKHSSHHGADSLFVIEDRVTGAVTVDIGDAKGPRQLPEALDAAASRRLTNQDYSFFADLRAGDTDAVEAQIARASKEGRLPQHLGPEALAELRAGRSTLVVGPQAGARHGATARTQGMNPGVQVQVIDARPQELPDVGTQVSSTADELTVPHTLEVGSPAGGRSPSSPPAHGEGSGGRSKAGPIVGHIANSLGTGLLLYDVAKHDDLALLGVAALLSPLAAKALLLYAAASLTLAGIEAGLDATVLALKAKFEWDTMSFRRRSF